MARMRRATNLWLIRFTGDRFGPPGFRLCDKRQRLSAKEEDGESEARAYDPTSNIQSSKRTRAHHVP